MTFTEIKKSFLGYNKDDVCRYVSELNELHGAELSDAKEQKKQSDALAEEKIKSLESENASAKERAESLEAELESLKARVAALESENSSLAERNNLLEESAAELESKRELISTAIINAEKCAGSLIDDATSRANDMISEAEDKVDVQLKRLETAKRYVAEMRTTLGITMRNIDNALISAEKSIDEKKESVKAPEVADISDSSASITEKRGFSGKGIFKRA